MTGFAFTDASLFSLTALLYYVCSVLLIGMALFILAKNPRAWQHQSFALTAASLLAWLVTLFLFNHAHDPATVLLLGRINFASIVFAAWFAYLLVRAVAELPPARGSKWLAGGTLLLALLSACTPLIDQSEVTQTGIAGHITRYGSLFPIYILYVSGCLVAAVITAAQVRRQTREPFLRDQLLLIAGGMLATGLVALVTNVLLPYAFGDFRFINVGTLSTILFLLAVAYAIVKHHLFDVRLLIRKTLVYGLLLSLVLAAYSALALLVTSHLAEKSAGGVTQFGILLIAFSFDPIRRFLEHRIDSLLFPHGKQGRITKSKPRP